MRYIISIALCVMVISGCKKNSCVQCSRQVAVKAQPTNITTNYEVDYVEYCGKQADSALSLTQDYYLNFTTEHGVTPYTCFYNQ